MLKHIIILSVLIIPLLGTGVGFATTTSNHQSVSIRTNKTVDSTSNQKLQADNLVYFNNNGFTNSTSINVTREVLVNSWAYTTITDKVSILSDEEFNAFNFTLPSNFYGRVDHLTMNTNSSGSMDQTPLAINQGSQFTVATFMFNNNVTTGVNATFTITMGVNSLVKVNQNNITFPYTASGFNFLPMFNFPITNYKYMGGIVTAGTVATNLLNTSIVPDPTSIGLTSEVNLGTGFKVVTNSYSDMQTLEGFNYTAAASKYSNAGNMKFIPSFEPMYNNSFTIPAEITYMIPQSPTAITSSEITITISEWGTITYEEKTTILNAGIAAFTISGASDSYVPVYVNANLSYWRTYDGFGNLTKSLGAPTASGSEFPTSSYLIKISPRSNIAPGTTFSYDLKYEVPAGQLLNETGGFFSPSWNLTLPAMSLFNGTNRHVDIKVIFPSISSVNLPSRMWGQDISSANMTNSGPFGLGHPVLRMSIDNFSYLDNIAGRIQISVPPVVGPFFSVFENAIYLFIVGLAIIIIRVAYQKFSHIVGSESTGDVSIPFELMREFVTAYEEKTALRSRLTELQEKRKNLRKVDYEQRVQTLKNKQLANDKKLVKATGELIKASPYYKDTIHNLELAEAERDQILSQIKDLDLKKKQSRIRPEIYNKMKSDQNNRLNKSITRIERILNELRSLLQEAR